MPEISMNGNFCDQVGGMTSAFEGWTACEKTVVLCALLRRVPTNSLKMIRHAIDAALAQNATAEDHRVECDANDTIYISKLVQGTEEELEVDLGNRISQLLVYLPLLKPGNDKAKDLYLRCIPHLVKHSMSVSQYTDECQQMLSYLLIHPALDSTDRRALTRLLRYLEGHVPAKGQTKVDTWQPPEWQAPASRPAWPTNANQTFRRTIGKNVEFKTNIEQVLSENSDSVCLQLNTADVLHESFSKNGIEIELNSENDRALFDPVIIQPKARRSNSLTPPSTTCVFMSSSSENLTNDPHFVQKPRSFSLSSEQCLLNIRSMGNLPQGSGSETKLDDLRYNNVGDHGGMSTVAHWLKTLRLHKYIWLFSNISYDEMMAIDEDYLQRLGVTKGARHKLLLSIKKLSERQSVLEGMERELSSGSFVPLAAMTALLEQLRNIVVSPIKPDSILATLVVRVLDLSSSRLLANGPSYTEGGGNVISLHCWLVDRALSHDAFSRSAALAAELKSLKYRVPPRQFLAHLGDAPFHRKPKPRWRACLGTTGWQVSDGGRKSTSYPPFSSKIGQQQPGLAPAASMGDINSRLESLCLQMTEQAIN